MPFFFLVKWMHSYSDAFTAPELGQPSVVCWTKIITREEETIAIKALQWRVEFKSVKHGDSDLVIGCKEWFTKGSRKHCFTNTLQILSPLNSSGPEYSVIQGEYIQCSPSFPIVQNHLQRRVLNAFYKYKEESWVWEHTVC